MNQKNNKGYSRVIIVLCIAIVMLSCVMSGCGTNPDKLDTGITQLNSQGTIDNRDVTISPSSSLERKTDAQSAKKTVELSHKNRTITMGVNYYAWIKADGRVEIVFSSPNWKENIVPGLNVGDSVSSWKNIVSLYGAADELNGFTENGEMRTSPNRSEFEEAWRFDGITFHAVSWPYWASFLSDKSFSEGVSNGVYLGEVLLTKDGTLYYISDFSDTPESVFVADSVVHYEGGYYLTKDGSFGFVGTKNQGNEQVLRMLENVEPCIGFATSSEGVFAITEDGNVVFAGYPWAYRYDISQWSEVVDVRAASGIVVALCKDGTIRYSAPGHKADPELEAALAWTDIVEIEVSLNGTDILAKNVDGDILLAVGKDSEFSRE